MTPRSAAEGQKVNSRGRMRFSRSTPATHRGGACTLLLCGTSISYSEEEMDTVRRVHVSGLGSIYIMRRIFHSTMRRAWRGFDQQALLAAL